MAGGRTNRAMLAVIGLVVVLVAALIAVVLVDRERERSAAAPTSPTGTPPCSTPVDRPGDLSPLTGQRVLVVKIDNVAVARPSTGLELAEMVYVEPVERGLSRLIAVFGDRRPEVVGPVRSARETDLGLLGQFGRPALAYSGAAAALTPDINAAPMEAIPPERAPAAFFRDFNRSIPHNLYLRPADLDAAGATAGVRPASDIGLRFGPAQSGGTPTSTHTERYESATIDLAWSAPDERWLVSFDGAPLTTVDGGQLGAATVVVQRVPMHLSPITDVTGAPSPVLDTVGAGDALILRDGMSYPATWSRPTPDQGTSLTLASGEPALLAPGPVWVVLVPA